MSPDATSSIAYLGPEGTYSEEAAVKYSETLGGERSLEPFPTIQAVALAVASGIADEGVAPIENSLEGSVTATLDILIQDSRLSIRDELVIPIEHTLLVVPGTKAADIQTIFSHPQALGQCRAYLDQCFPNAQRIASLSTVSAIDDVWASPVPAAAISPMRAAELRKMETLARGIQDNSSNETRFVALAREDHPATGHDKTSICFSFAEDKPGMLYNTLGEFAIRNINLAKIESRPTKESLGLYWFLVDFNGHREDQIVQGVLDFIKGQTSMFRIFGSYPRRI